MESFYEYFYEITTNTIPIALGFWMFKDVLNYRLNRNRFLSRTVKHSPFKLRLKAMINRSIIGKLNLRGHIFWNNFFHKNTKNLFQHVYHKYSYYTIVSPIFALGFGGLLGFLFSDHYEIFQRPQFPAPYVLASDKSVLYLMHAKNPLIAQINVHRDMKIKIWTNSYSALDFVQWGHIFSNALQEEISFQCYYIAHLMDPDNIKTNSELQFSTYDPSKESALEE